MSSKNRPRNLPYNPLSKERSRKLRNQPTPTEKLFWNSLRKMLFYESVTFNRQKPIGNFIVDFYCHRFQLVIEIDGDTHGQTLIQNRDAERTRFLESHGLTVLRFTNREVEGNIEAVLVKVESLIERCKYPQPPSSKGGESIPSLVFLLRRGR